MWNNNRIEYSASVEPDGWLIVLVLNGPWRQYFSLYQAVSQREGERRDK